MTKPWEYDQAKHLEDVGAMLRATIEIAGLDRREMLIVERTQIESVSTNARHLWVFQAKNRWRIEAALAYGMARCVFIPSSHADEFDGRLPRELPENWEELPNGLETFGEDGEGWFCVEEGQRPERVLGKPGLVVMQPQTGTAVLGKRLRLLEQRPEEQPIWLAQRALYLREEDVVQPASVTAELPLNEEQKAAIAHKKTNAVTLVWGPPGTGKSQLIVGMMEHALAEGQSVCLVATTNKAVDAVAEKILKSRELWPRVDHAVNANRVTRYGQLGNPALLGELSMRRRLGRAPTGEDTARQFESDQVSLMTVTSFLTAQVRTWDVVMLDEAGTTAMPFSYALLAAARKKVVVVGDHSQIPPVMPYRRASSETKSWFSKSLFQFIGARHDGSDRRLCLLPVQYRMRERLAENVRATGLYPAYITAGGEKELDAKGKKAINLEPLAGREFVVVDTSDTPYAGRWKDNTHEGHYEWVTKLVASYARIGGYGHLGIVTPYRNQASKYMKWVADSGKQTITAGTVHVFQGSEANVIIYDTGEGTGAGGVTSSLFFADETKHEESLNLLNVALSRPSYKLVMVAECGLLKSRLPEGSCLRRLIATAEARGEVVRPEVALAQAGKGGVFVPFMDRSQIEVGSFDPFPTTMDAGLLPAQFLADVAAARTELRVFSPEVDPGFALQVIGQISAVRKGMPPLVVRLYVSRLAFRGVELPMNGEVLWSIEPPSKWGVSQSELVFDARLAYSGVPSLLGGKCQPIVVRKYLRH
jgi:hypothetical protein